jgi:hypothetical protein
MEKNGTKNANCTQNADTILFVPKNCTKNAIYVRYKPSIKGTKHAYSKKSGNQMESLYFNL